jgi:hypothetical protein
MQWGAAVSAEQKRVVISGCAKLSWGLCQVPGGTMQCGIRMTEQ